MPNLIIEHQHGRLIEVNLSMRLIIFTAKKNISYFVNQLLDTEKQRVFFKMQAVYVADLSALPSIVTHMFTLPKHRVFSFAIGLAREAALLVDLPHRTGFSTVARLRGGKIDYTNIKDAKDAVQLCSTLTLEI